MPNRTCFQKLLGVNMSIASPLVIGLGIADLIITYQHYCKNQDQCTPLQDYLVLSWVGIGIWAPIVTFVNGLLAVSMAGRCPEKGVLCVLSFFSTFVFMPALIIVTVLELTKKFGSVPSGASALTAMFGIEVAIAVAGVVLLLHAFGVLHLNCCCKKFLAVHVVKEPKQPASKEPSNPEQPALGVLGQYQNPYQNPRQPLLQGQPQPQLQPQPQPQPQPQLQLLQGGVQPPQAGVYRLGYYQPGTGQYLANRYYSGGNYQVPREVLAGARW